MPERAFCACGVCCCVCWEEGAWELGFGGGPEAPKEPQDVSKYVRRDAGVRDVRACCVLLLPCGRWVQVLYELPGPELCYPSRGPSGGLQTELYISVRRAWDP